MARKADGSGVLASLLADPDGAAEYAWFLGAGASLSSGAPLAWQITRTLSDGSSILLWPTDASDDAEIEGWLQAAESAARR